MNPKMSKHGLCITGFVFNIYELGLNMTEFVLHMSGFLLTITTFVFDKT